jgi:diguanylate cyclase (GGDEF)-like protein
MGQDDEHRKSIPPEEGAPTIGADGHFRLSRDDILKYQQSLENRRGSLLVIAGNPADIGNTLVFAEAAVIGREQANLQLKDGLISRRHAVVEKWSTDYVVKDNGSTNGTMVNGEPIAGVHQLHEGDRIHVGETVIKFTLVDDTEASYLRKMDQMVGTDELTGLMAKHRFDAALEEALRTARHTGTYLSVMMMDMDRLKQVNDTHGHHMGAGTIRQVGQQIGEIVTGLGEACRFGGDEFSAFLRGFPLPAAISIAERIRATVETTNYGPPDLDVRVSISIGVAELPAGVETIRALVDLADRALYRAKEGGRNVVCG